ncbi:MAG: hypothetical protein RJB13_1001 [Pseudomonadota bacterium]|jgi:geranylgeranyl pyrophosphate synthase
MTRNKTVFDTHIETHLSSIFIELEKASPELKHQWKLMAEAMLYPVSAGGKRVRPHIVKLMAEALGAPENHEAVTMAGCSIELVHTYSLVHDDLPCMDNDDFRRGRPTAHKIYGDANALLIGDALLTEAFSLMTKLQEKNVPSTYIVQCIEKLSRFAGLRGMVAGQWLDLAFEQDNGNAHWPALATIHNLKTGALLSASFSVGALLGTALSAATTSRVFNEPKERELIRKAESIGQQAGLAFQLIDDILDSSQSSEKLGKTAGKDRAQGKLTAISLLGLDEAKRLAVQLTESCLSSMSELSSIASTHPNLSVSKSKFDALNHFIGELLERTS